MSRHGYSDDYDCDDQWRMIMYQGAVASAIRGKRGQALLRDLLAALDAMPAKRLIAEDLQTPDGEVCALGCLARARGRDVSKLDPEDVEAVAKEFGIAETLVREITYANDEGGAYPMSPEQRWEHMRRWVERKIANAAPGPDEEGRDGDR